MSKSGIIHFEELQGDHSRRVGSGASATVHTPTSAVELLQATNDVIRAVAFLHSRPSVVLASKMTSVAPSSPHPELAGGKCANASCAHDVYSIGVIVREVTELVKPHLPEDVKKVLGEVVAACTSSEVTMRPSAKSLLASFEGTEPTPLVYECQHCGRRLPLTEAMGAHLNDPEFLLDHKVSAMMKRIVTPLEKRIADLATVLANTKDSEGRTPLIVAVKNNSDPATRSLLHMGADVNARDKDGLTPLHYAESHDVAQVLLKNGADVNATNNNNETALFLAARNGHHDVARVLLENGADVNAKNSDNDTPLLLAARFGHHDVAMVLLENGADVNATNNNNETALFRATRNDHPDVARVLLENGADVNVKNSDDETPLLLAAQYGRHDVAKVLLENGADANAKYRDLMTPLAAASRYGHQTVVALLQCYGAVM